MQPPDDKNIIPIWQPVGYSTYKITKDIACKYGKKATHTGVLDPMAEGVILVLLGEERFNKFVMTDTKKGYVFTLSFGISTDSYDGMGLITDSDFSCLPDEYAINRVLGDLTGEYTQKVPLYSARKVREKKLFMYPKLGLKTPELPEKKGVIYEHKLLKFDQKVMVNSVISEVINRIKSIKYGEFRQEKIVSEWERYLRVSKDIRTVQAEIYAEVSKGLYIRSLSQDICSKLNTKGFVSSLVRVKNGVFTRDSTYDLQDVLG